MSLLRGLITLRNKSQKQIENKIYDAILIKQLMLGNIEDPTDKRMKSINAELKKNVKNSKKIKHTFKQVSNINTTLSKGLTVSMNVIVDIGKVLKSYHYFLDEVEDLVSQLDDSHSINSKSINELKTLTDAALKNLHSNYNEQLDEIVKAYKKNNMDASNFTEFKNMIDKDNNDVPDKNGK